MSIPFTFTRAQRALVEAPDSFYAEACPGAGKTQAIVQRFVERPSADARRGIALLSFTNAAVDEARSRCAGQPELLRSPNFVGTIDGFINRFIVGPIYSEQTGRAATFRDTWRNVSGSAFGVKSVPGQFQLDWFEYSMDGDATLRQKLVPADRRYSLPNLADWQKSKLQDEASRRWLRNVDRGVFDAATSRLYAKQYLSFPEVCDSLADLFAGRFSEVIVDEVQDCCEEDVSTLQLVRDAGVRLVMIGDPDQAIYGFRGASAGSLATLRKSVKTGTRLNGNFRSSAAICSIVDSLRAGSSTDQPLGKNATVAHAVQLIEYKTPKAAQTRIREALARYNFSSDDLVVLSHGNDKARACAGAPPRLKHSANRLVGLAVAVHALQEDTTPPKERVEAMRMFERVLRQLAPEELADYTEEEFLDELGLSGREYSERVLRLATSLDPPYLLAPSSFKSQLAGQVDAQQRLRWSLDGVKNPKNDEWPDVPSNRLAGSAYSTVHRYKGLQAPAVALVVPDRPSWLAGAEDGVDLWMSGKQGEARNVLYVGASRAEKLLLLVVHTGRYETVKQVLVRDNVTFEDFQ